MGRVHPPLDGKKTGEPMTGRNGMTVSDRKLNLLRRMAKRAVACRGPDRRIATALAREGLAALSAYQSGVATFQITPAGRRRIALGG